jgi:DNA-binding response OmpR family regulator
MTRILLADDSPHAQRMGEQILGDEGFEVVTVSDGDSALLRLADVDPDLVLAAVGTPKRSGYEICQYVKLSPMHRHARVLLSAGVKDSVDEAEVRRVMADGVVQKPFEASVLLSLVKSLVEEAAKARSPGSSHPPAAAPRPAPKPLTVALIDPECVRAAVTVALDAALPDLIEEITDKVLVAFSSR